MTAPVTKADKMRTVVYEQGTDRTNDVLIAAVKEKYGVVCAATEIYKAKKKVIGGWTPDAIGAADVPKTQQPPQPAPAAPRTIETVLTELDHVNSEIGRLSVNRVALITEAEEMMAKHTESLGKIKALVSAPQASS